MSSKDILAVIMAFVLASWAGCCPPEDPVARYIAFGDSITEGAEQPSYPDLLEGMFAEGEGTVANEGESGETAGEGRDQMDEILACGTYPNAHTVLYLEGGGGLIDWIQEHAPLLLVSPLSPLYLMKRELEDLLDNIEENVLAVMQAVKASGRTPFIATYYHFLPYKIPCPPSPVDFLTEFQTDNANDYIDMLNDRLRHIATLEGLELVDIAETGALYGDYDNFHDCNHPSVQGNQIIADYFFEAIVN